MKVVAEIQYTRGNQIGVGQGMNSKVYLAQDPQLGGQFAVKEIEKSRFGNSIARYFEEAQIMFATAHPNVVPIQYACQTATHVVLAMPYFSKGSLALRISSGPITISELIRIAQGVLSGVSRIHLRNFVHFDIKPSNILFGNTGAPLVADFGQSRKILSDGTVQVPHLYLRGVPPEIWTGAVGTALSDIYQAGLLLYRAVNGDPWYQKQLVGLDDMALCQRVIAGKLPDRKSFLPHVPKRVQTIIRKALHIDLSKRYQSASELSAAMARIRPSLNWLTTSNANGELLWCAERPGKATLEVELIPGSCRWDVRVWTSGLS